MSGPARRGATSAAVTFASGTPRPRFASSACSATRSATAGVGVPCWSGQGGSAWRCDPPFGVRSPERSRSAVTLSAPASCVGAGVAVIGAGPAVHAARPSASATAARRALTPVATLGARSVGARGALRVHVGQRILGPRVRLALRLRDGLLDLVRELHADRLEVRLTRARAEEVLASPLHRVAGLPLLDLLLGPVAAVVVVGRMRLVAVALQLDERGPFARARVIGGKPGLLVAVEDVHPVGDVSRHRVRGGAVRDVGHGHLLLEARGYREKVVLDDEDDGQLVDRGEVRGLVEVTRACRGLAAEREDDALLLAVAEGEGEAHRVGEL